MTMDTSALQLHGFSTDERIEARIFGADSPQLLFEALTDLRELSRRAPVSLVVDARHGFMTEDVHDALAASRLTARRLVVVIDASELERRRMTRADVGWIFAMDGAGSVHVETDFERALLGTALLLHPAEAIGVVTNDETAALATDMLARALDWRGSWETTDAWDSPGTLRRAS